MKILQLITCFVHWEMDTGGKNINMNKTKLLLI